MIPLIPLVVGGAALGIVVARRKTRPRVRRFEHRAPIALLPGKDPRASAYGARLADKRTRGSAEQRPRYVVAVSISFPASLLATTDKVVEHAQKMGISDAVASRKPPRDLPMAKADFYVTGTFAGEASTIPRSYADGKVRIVDVARVS